MSRPPGRRRPRSARRPGSTLSGRNFVVSPRQAPTTPCAPRAARRPVPVAASVPPRPTGRRRGAGRLFALLGVARVVQRPPLGGQPLPDALDVVGFGQL